MPIRGAKVKIQYKTSRILEIHNKMASSKKIQRDFDDFDEPNPKDLRLSTPIREFLKEIKKLSSLNQKFKTYIGLGYHDTFTPSVIQRNILENPGWYTAYTPYQAEIAQGRLEALLNFQTMVTDLTGMEISNASLLDESTAAAEAMTLLFSTRSRNQKKENINSFFVSADTFPQTLALLETRARPLGIKLEIAQSSKFDPEKNYFGAFFQCFSHIPAVCPTVMVTVQRVQ